MKNICEIRDYLLRPSGAFMDGGRIYISRGLHLGLRALATLWLELQLEHKEFLKTLIGLVFWLEKVREDYLNLRGIVLALNILVGDLFK